MLKDGGDAGLGTSATGLRGLLLRGVGGRSGGEKAVGNRARSWKAIEGHGRSWKAMEGHGGPWRAMEGHGRAWRPTEGHATDGCRCGNQRTARLHEVLEKPIRVLEGREDAPGVAQALWAVEQLCWGGAEGGRARGWSTG